MREFDRDAIHREIEVGGNLKDLPCIYCKKPRCDRSDYIRCSSCGRNWKKGTDYSAPWRKSWDGVGIGGIKSE